MQILHVFPCERWRAQFDPRQIDALVIAQNSAGNHLAAHGNSVGGQYFQFDAAIGQQHWIARFHVFGEMGVARGCQ